MTELAIISHANLAPGNKAILDAGVTWPATIASTLSNIYSKLSTEVGRRLASEGHLALGKLMFASQKVHPPMPKGPVFYTKKWGDRS